MLPDGAERHLEYHLLCTLESDTGISGDNREINSQQAGAMEHRHDSIDPLQLLARNVQPEIERLCELRSDLLSRRGRDVCVGFEEDLERPSRQSNTRRFRDFLLLFR